jgi:formate dehydrogenase maturation protein FdhE
MKEDSEDRTQTAAEWAAEFLQHLEVDFVKRIALNFIENVEQVNALIRMPEVLFGFLEIEHQYRESFANLAQKHWGGDYVSFLADMLTQWSEKWGEKRSGKSSDLKTDRVKALLTEPPYSSLFRKSMAVLRSAAVSASWTAFECLAADLWVGALNENPRLLAQATIATLSRDDAEVNSKQISMRLAAKY